jgi:hypothetical protein
MFGWKLPATLMPDDELLECFCEENENDVEHFRA